MEMTKYIEISRFTYFFENTKFPKKDIKECQGLEKWSEIEEREQMLGNIDEALPFSQNIQDFWNKQCDSSQTTNNLGQQIFVHSFPALENKIFIFETKVQIPFEEIEEGLNNIKTDRTDVLLKIIKTLNSSWCGEYSADNDYFYFINLKVDTLFREIEDIVKRDEKIVSQIQDKLNINGKCIFEHLDFVDKTFPRISRLEDDLNFVIENEKQPLIVISPARDANKFIIPDEKLFVRCYQEDSTSLPIRLVLKTLLFQKAFIEYASTASINITENQNANLSYIALSKAFSKFIDYLWRVEISNSFYLNKSYRIIGKIWLLNSKFEILKNHLDRNSIFEDRQNQDKFAYIAQITVVILGLFTLISTISDIDQLLKSFEILLSKRIFIDIPCAGLGILALGYVFKKLRKMRI